MPGLVAYMCPEVEGGEGGQVVLEAVAEMFNSKKKKKKRTESPALLYLQSAAAAMLLGLPTSHLLSDMVPSPASTSNHINHCEMHSQEKP